jgi:hypothetical protein|tara:strand:+ start:81 stop:509 length:429 start_codon:yes stop_codon:yes gene_type:complete
MLAELAAANAAFAVIKQAVQNSGDLARAGGAIAKFVGAKEGLEKKVAGKNKSSVGGSDLEAFLALERVKEAEYQLKQLMIYTGRPRLWSDWQAFQAKCRTERREAEKKAARRKQFILEMFVGAMAVFMMVGIAGIIAYYLRS